MRKSYTDYLQEALSKKGFTKFPARPDSIYEYQLIHKDGSITRFKSKDEYYASPIGKKSFLPLEKVLVNKSEINDYVSLRNEIHKLAKDLFISEIKNANSDLNKHLLEYLVNATDLDSLVDFVEGVDLYFDNINNKIKNARKIIELYNRQ